MKKFLIAAAALGSVALVAPANAADLPVKAPPVVMPALYNWSGLYIGPEGGAVMGQKTDWHYLNIPGQLGFPPNIPLCTVIGPGFCADVGHPLHGGFVGGEAGFNWQAPGNRWVFGIEGDGNWAELEESLTCATFPADLCGSKIRDFETVRARIGYAFGPRGDFLAYITGGWATASVGAFKGEFFAPFPTITQWQRVNGFVVGGGAEYGITPWLSLKGEVLYVWLEGKDFCFSDATPLQGTPNFGCARATLTPQGVVLNPAHVKEDFVLARMGLNWRLWWGKGKGPAPVVASY